MAHYSPLFQGILPSFCWLALSIIFFLSAMLMRLVSTIGKYSKFASVLYMQPLYNNLKETVSWVSGKRMTEMIKNLLKINKHKDIIEKNSPGHSGTYL